MSSNSQSNGTASINLTFAAGTDIDRAQMDVQNRLRRVEQRLPEDVRRQGIQVNEANAGFLMIVALTSKSGQMESLEIGNFANTKVVDELRRVEGVGNVQSFSPELCDAHLARSRQARQLQPVAGRSAARGAGTE